MLQRTGVRRVASADVRLRPMYLVGGTPGVHRGAMCVAVDSDSVAGMPRTAVPARPVLPQQYPGLTIVAVWAAAALPMGMLAWVVVPFVANRGADPARFAPTLIGGYTIGLFWQFVLVLWLVAREQGSLRWSVLRDALWLRRPNWWWVLAVTAGIGLVELIPLDPAGPASRALDTFLGSDSGKALFHGNWALFALCVTMFALNTVFGEELLFRGLLLPRMRGTFGNWDWVANGVLFGVYHLHQPWTIPSGIATGMLQAYAVRRRQSTWIGIIAHSAQSILFTVLILLLVLS